MAPDETSVFSVCSVAPETVSPTTPAEADSVSVPASVSADGVAPEAVSASSFRPVAPLAESDVAASSSRTCRDDVAPLEASQPEASAPLTSRNAV